MHPSFKLVGFGMALGGLAACQGLITGADGGTGQAPPGIGVAPGTGPEPSTLHPNGSDPNAVGPRPLSRLTRRQYNNTVRDLLGDTTRPADAFPDDHDRTFQFRRAGLVATQDAEVLRSAAEKLAATAIGSLAALLPCAAAADDACAAQFIDDFGLKAYRRPLSEPEVTRLKGLYANARTTLGMSFAESIGVLLESMLQSPAFLYHWESPYQAPQVDSGNVVLGQYEVASRLSYFIWGSMPDKTLFDLAKAGQLGTDAEIAAQAQRLLQDDRARDAVRSFFGEWLEIDHLEALPKDSGTYPDYDDALKRAMIEQNSAFVENVLFEAGGRFETLLTADFTFSNQTLSGVYGETASGASLTKVALNTSQRLGLLTQPGFLSVTGSPDGSNPIKRGKTIFEKFLCGTLPPPPANVPPAKPASSGGTTRQRFAEHGKNECARGCHALMDPIGFAFEHYDGIGRYRTMDNGGVVDASGTINVDGADHAFSDAVELTRILAGSEQVRSCFAKQWFRFAMGRPDTEADGASLAAIATAFASNQYDMRDLAPAIAVSRSFRYRSPAAGEVLP